MSKALWWALEVNKIIEILCYNILCTEKEKSSLTVGTHGKGSIWITLKILQAEIEQGWGREHWQGEL